MSEDEFHTFGCLFVKKIKSKVFVCFYEITLLIVKILPETIFRDLVLALRLRMCFLKPSVTLNSVPKAGHDMYEYTENNRPMRKQARLSEQCFELVFSKKQENFIFIFLKQARPIRTSTERIDLICIGFQTKYSSGDPVHLIFICKDWSKVLSNKCFTQKPMKPVVKIIAS